MSVSEKVGKQYPAANLLQLLRSPREENVALGLEILAGLPDAGFALTDLLALTYFTRNVQIRRRAAELFKTTAPRRLFRDLTEELHPDHFRGKAAIVDWYRRMRRKQTIDRTVYFCV